MLTTGWPGSTGPTIVHKQPEQNKALTKEKTEGIIKKEANGKKEDDKGIEADMDSKTLEEADKEGSKDNKGKKRKAY